MTDRRTFLGWISLALGLCDRMPEPEHEDEPVPSLGDPDRVLSVRMRAQVALGLHRSLATGTPMTGPDVAQLLVALHAELFR